MGEKGMDTGGPGAQMAATPGGRDDQVAAAPGGQDMAQGMGGELDNQGQPPPPPQSSGPDAGEIIGDIFDPLGIHKLFE
jgi:hypothetical protein